MNPLKNVLITGANGQLGLCIKEIVEIEQDRNYQYFFTDVDDLDITNKQDVESYFSKNEISAVLNCAAYTAVDKAESEPEKAFLINEIGVGNLAEVCAKLNILLVHISTDYVFDGAATSPYKTNASTNPVSTYGKSKHAGERKVLAAQGKSVIIRTSWLCSKYGANFVKTMLRLGNEKAEIKGVADQFGAPTFAPDLAEAMLKIVDNQEKICKPTYYHFANEGIATWYEFATEIMKIANLKCKVIPIPTSEYPTPAVRPKYSVFDLAKIKKEFQISIPIWQESLESCIKQLK